MLILLTSECCFFFGVLFLLRSVASELRSVASELLQVTIELLLVVIALLLVAIGLLLITIELLLITIALLLVTIALLLVTILFLLKGIVFRGVVLFVYWNPILNKDDEILSATADKLLVRMTSLGEKVWIPSEFSGCAQGDRFFGLI